MCKGEDISMLGNVSQAHSNSILDRDQMSLYSPTCWYPATVQNSEHNLINICGIVKYHFTLNFFSVGVVLILALASVSNLDSYYVLFDIL